MTAVIDSPGVWPLPDGELASYRTRGWCRAPGVFTGAELSGLRREADRVAILPGVFSPEGRGAIAGSEGRVDRLDPVIDVSPLFGRTSKAPKLLALAEQVLGGEPHLFKDRIIFKWPGVRGYGAHQDAAYWQGYDVPLDGFATLAICLDDATPEAGAIECSSGQHHQLLTRPGIVDDVAEEQLTALTPLLAMAGDVLLIHPLTPHCSGYNRSNAPRRVLTFVYALGDSGLYERYQQGRVRGSAE